jgi:hypothetical protein
MVGIATDLAMLDGTRISPDLLHRSWNVMRNDRNAKSAIKMSL